MERYVLQQLSGLLDQIAEGYSLEMWPGSSQLKKIHEAVDIDLENGPQLPLWDRVRSIICDPYAGQRLQGPTLKEIRRLILSPEEFARYQFGPLICAECEKVLEERVVVGISGQQIFCTNCLMPTFKCSNGHFQAIGECQECQSAQKKSARGVSKIEQRKIERLRMRTPAYSSPTRAVTLSNGALGSNIFSLQEDDE